MKNENISITLPEETLKYLDNICAEKKLKRSQVVELLIGAHKTQLEAGNELLPIYKVSMPDRQAYLTPDEIESLKRKGFTVTQGE